MVEPAHLAFQDEDGVADHHLDPVVRQVDARLTAVVAGLLAATLGTLVLVGLRIRRLARET